jgi:hypothetical protein
MQTFTTHAPNRARLDTSTIDFAMMPSQGSLSSPPLNELAGMRMPLLPDNYTTQHAPEVADAPLAAPEIVVVAAHPENVVTAALTEVEGMGIDGVELKFAHESEPEVKEPGMLTDLWKGLLDDLAGPGQSSTKPAV